MTKNLSDWVGMFALYRGSDPFSTMASGPMKEQLNEWLSSNNLRHGDIERHENGGCWVCGQTNYSHYVVAARFEGDSQKPVQVIEVGHICAEELGMSSMERTYEREANQNRRKAEAQKFVADNGLTDFAQQVANGDLKGWDWGQDTASDIFAYINRKGYASEAQLKLLNSIATKHADFQERKNTPKAEEVAIPEELFDGRHTFTGTVVANKMKYTDFGAFMKMTVEVPSEGGSFRIWGTTPKGIDKGDTVQFDATLNAGSNPSFAFFKRPTKVKKLS